MRILPCLILLVLTVSTVAAGQSDPTMDIQRFRTLEHGILRCRYRSMGWTRMGYYDEAIEELRSADELVQALRILLGTDYQKDSYWGWNLQAEIDLVLLRAEAHEIVVKQFSLPDSTLGFIKVEPYERTESALVAVLYTVGPEGLTRERIAGDPLRYYEPYIPGSKSYIATYAAEGPQPATAETRYRKLHEIALPDESMPLYVTNKINGFLVVHVAAKTADKTRTEGAVLLQQGQVVQLQAGPCAGPAVVPAVPEGGLDGLMFFGYTQIWALKKTPIGTVMARYEASGQQQLCAETITFDGKNIIEVARRKGEGWETSFDASLKKPITADQAVLLARYYGTRNELERRPVVSGCHYFGAPHSSFDAAKRRWTMNYTWGRVEIAGGNSTIVLDEWGNLVDISAFVMGR